MPSRRSGPYLAIALAAIAAVVASYFAFVAQKNRHPAAVKIGYQALSSSWAFYAANERLPGRTQSFFEEEGLVVSPVRFDSANNALQAMLSGEVATDSALTMTAVLTLEEKSPGSLQCFGFQMHTKDRFLESLIASKSSGIVSYADLKGKRIGVFPGSLSRSLTGVLVEPFFDPAKDLQIVELAPPLQLQALAQGDVDALLSYEPTTSLALKRGIAQVIEHSPWAKRIFEPFPVAAYCFTTAYLREQPLTAAAIVRAWKKAIVVTRSDPAAAASAIPKYTGIPAEVAPTLNQPLQQTAAEVDAASFRRLVELYQRFGLLSRPVDPLPILLRD